MIKQYESYKPIKSSVYKEAPITWKKYRVKDTVDKNTYYPVGDGDHGSIKPEMYQEDGIPYIRVQNLTWHGEILTDGIVCISEEVQLANKKSKLYPGDILIAKTGATIGKLGLITESIKEANTTSSVGKITVDKKRFSPKYILYCFQSRALQDQIWLEASQKSAQPGFNIDDLIVFEILAPDLGGQLKVVEYLDHQTIIIDKLIQQKEKLIELLKEKRQAVINEVVTKGLNPNAKMKESGIASFGSIPEKWVVTKLKYLSNVKGRIGFRGYTTDDLVEEGKGALALGASHITWEGEIDLSNPVFISWPKYEESPEIKLNTGDIIIVQRGSTCGKVAIISSEIGPATINPSLVVLKEIQADPYYVFVSIKAALQELVNLTRSAAIPMLSQEQIGNLQIVLPPIEEQKIISDFLLEKKNRFNDSINKLNESISKLYEYRQSIISEAVTGKIDVRDWQPNKNQVA